MALTLSIACGGEMPAVDSGAGMDAGPLPDGDVMQPDRRLGDGGDAACANDVDCDDGLFCTGFETCALASPDADERGCVSPGEPPCALGQTCAEATDHCDTECDVDADADGDGVDSMDCGGADCDDADPNRRPGGTEICDTAMHDEDCDAVTFGVRDADGDDEPDARCCNVEDDGTTRHCGTDCDDTRAGVNPTAPEVCNGRDDDCDTGIDETVLTIYYVDVDMDGHGTSDSSVPAITACAPRAGYATTNNDCLDSNGAVNPGVGEMCDPAMVDENCSGVANEDCSCTVGASRGCTSMGICAAGTEPCSASGMWGSCSIGSTPEECNGIDDDCDGMVDDGVRINCYVDADNDGYARSGASATGQCPVAGRPGVGGCPVNYTNLAPVTPSEDCDDTLSSISPLAIEICDMRDNDCDSMIDDGVGVACYVDGDNDGYASMGVPPAQLCPIAGRPEFGGCAGGYTNRAPVGISSSDCNESASLVHPGALEACDSIDNDCNGVVDDGMTVRCWNDGDDDGYAPAGASSNTYCPIGARTAVGGCPTNTTNRDPAVAGQADCSDGDDDIRPGALEVCDGIDNDCNGVDDATRVACWNDPDNDTYAASGATSTPSCPDPTRTSVGLCPNNTTNRDPTPAAARDCAPSNPSVNPSIMEMCQIPAFDQNCNGNADEGYVVCFAETDGDGFAVAGATSLTAACPVLGGYGGCGAGYTSRDPAVAGNTDCDPADTLQNPLGTEVCNGEDDNCNGLIDEGFFVTRMYYRDNDRDGFGAGSLVPVSVPSCSGLPTSFSTNDTDCCDSEGGAYPGALYFSGAARIGCGGFDYNCDGAETHKPSQLGMACSCSTATCIPPPPPGPLSASECYSGPPPPCGTVIPYCACSGTPCSCGVGIAATFFTEHTCQ